MSQMSADKPFDNVVEEDAALEKMGYQAELKRSFNLLSMIGFCFSIVTCWSALSGVLIIGAESGGPPVMVWSWLGVCAFSLAVAYSMAEMCSAYPVAGGQYSWAAILAPRKWARGFSYVCGWFMLTGILAMGAVNNFITAEFILGVAVLNNPDYVITRWQTTLVAYGVAFVGLGFNVFLPQLLHKVSRFFLIWNICSFVIIIVTILACNDHKQSASFVFKDFQNFTGFGTAYTAILGLLQTAFGMCCYDAPSHMTEEIVNARKEAPRAIVLSVWIGAATGFVFLIAACFCIGSIEGVAGSATGVPILQIFYDSTGSVAGSSCLTVLLIVIDIGCANALTAEGGRAVYAFARDNGLPFSKVWSKVDAKKQIPVFAILLTVLVQIALNSIYFGTVTGFNTVVSIATEGFYVSYAMPLLVRVLSRLSGKETPLEGPWSLGRWSLLVNIIGLLYLLFTSITFNFPTVNPVDSENMNYTSAAIGVIMLIAIITWVTTGRKNFAGPPGAVIEGRSQHDSEEVSTVGHHTKEME
ncbi:hypothetical protein AAFC00_001694 [Neodothiora populina]|uniref:GABA permease n=1 Tax=Neodothiora populina TaxID=2781224 RepID=A0ABR3PPU4_9PEZI